VVVVKNKLKNMIKLRSRLTVYVPSTKNVKESIDNEKYVDNCAKMLSEYFGGATSTPAIGYWLSESHDVVKEKTVMVFAYANDSDLDKHIDDVVSWCEKLKKELSQEAIALEVNGDMYFI
jgi:hypothetical protein